MSQKGGFRPFGESRCNGKNAQIPVIARRNGERVKSTRGGLSGVFAQARIPEADNVREPNSPRILGAKCASNAVSFLVLGRADRKFIVDIGED
jgi:hypothetical protein